MSQGHLYARVHDTIPGHLTGRMRGMAQASAWLNFWKIYSSWTSVTSGKRKFCL